MVGYFGDNGVPDEFWRLYAVYAAMTVFGSVVWAVRLSSGEAAEMRRLVETVIGDHDGFGSFVPRWYAERRG